MGDGLISGRSMRSGLWKHVRRLGRHVGARPDGGGVPAKSEPQPIVQTDADTTASAHDWRDPACSAQLSIAQHLRWMIDDFAVSDGVMSVRGWFLSPFHPVEAARFLVNDRDVVAPAAIHPGSDVQDLLPELPNSAFRFQVDHPASSDQRFSSIKFLPSGQIDGAVVESSAWYLLDPLHEDDPLPGGDNIFRVIANRDAFSFRIGGATVVNRIDAYLARAHGRTLADFGPILDWGCGCGRVTRYLKKRGCRDLHGVDVDATNIEWSRANLADIAFQTVGLEPPLPYPDGFFELIIGVSVFTHLREPQQHAWLAELARVLKPGGLAIVTVMSGGQIALQRGGADAIAELARSGFVITDDNDQLRFGEGGENYYVNTYHSAEYLHANWQADMTLVDLVPFMGANQDAVVLRRTPDPVRL